MQHRTHLLFLLLTGLAGLPLWLTACGESESNGDQSAATPTIERTVSTAIPTADPERLITPTAPPQESIAPAVRYTITLKNDLELPDLRGPFQVGRTSAYARDIDRPALPGSKDFRELVFTIFYPAAPEIGSAAGPYAEEALAESYAGTSLTEDSANTLSYIHAHAYVNAKVDRAKESYPTLLFSPGGGEQPLFYTSLLEELSSHGYVVVSVPEPFDTPAIPLPDGRVLTRTQLDEWCKQDVTCEKALKGDLNAIEELDATLKDDRAKDMILVLDQLALINEDDSALLKGAMDLTKVGAFGHSFGGASAVRVAQLDARIDAVADPDGDIYNAVSADAKPLSQPVLYFTAANIDLPGEALKEVGELNAATRAYFVQHAPYYFVDIAETTHQSFQTDAMFLAPYVFIGGQGAVLHGPDTTPARITEVISNYLVAFFQQHLQGAQQSLLAGPSSDYPEVTFESKQ